jgi:hypothetical protein
MLSVTDNSSLYYFVSFAIHQFIQGDQDPKFFLNQVISSKDTSMLFGVSSHHFTVSFTVSLHSFTSQFCFTPHFPKGFQEFPSSKVRFKLRGFLLGEASTVAAAADCGAPIWRRFAFRARINRGCLRRHGGSEWLKMIGTLIFFGSVILS